jgi:hypothetical protein
MAWRRVLTVSVLALSVSAASSHAVDVLVLGENASEIDITFYLNTVGHSAEIGPRYWEWTGSNPSPMDFDVVILPTGDGFGHDLTAGGLAALTAAIASGRGFVTSEWSLFDVFNGDKSEAYGALLPVTTPSGVWGTSQTWTVTSVGHPLVENLPQSWSDGARWTVASPKAGTTVVVTGNVAGAMVSYWNSPGGTVIHINHDLTDHVVISDEAFQVIENAVRFAASRVFADGFESGDLTRWTS